MSKLKPCPFCQSDDITIWDTDEGRGGFQVCCCECFSRTWEYDTRQQAVRAWNKRRKYTKHNKDLTEQEPKQ
jgi:hypothetical protein